MPASACPILVMTSEIIAGSFHTTTPPMPRSAKLRKVAELVTESDEGWGLGMKDGVEGWRSHHLSDSSGGCEHTHAEKPLPSRGADPEGIVRTLSKTHERSSQLEVAKGKEALGDSRSTTL